MYMYVLMYLRVMQLSVKLLLRLELVHVNQRRNQTRYVIRAALAD